MPFAGLNRAGYVILRYCDMLVVPVTECNRPIKKEIQPQSDHRTFGCDGITFSVPDTQVTGNKRQRRFSLADKRQARLSLADKMFEIT